jgi:galactose mutarotase-like enzyme
VRYLSSIQINDHLFDEDALVYSGFSSNKVRLIEKSTSRYIEVMFDGFEYLGLWSKPGAKYVCIEPWCGRSDTLDNNCDIDKRIGNFTVPANASFKQTYSIEFGY